ncbi:AAA-like domain-containing protein [Trichormus sp. NMC-1]|uniref:AAA-like domain-containing protein n=1 Tax=Trichormus sp. NMC-1 TaxID=1853259 RepID=UPI0008DC0FA4|nr:AAA-like domain-containing protein [Trichormus sp. NMC-1]
MSYEQKDPRLLKTEDYGKISINESPFSNVGLSMQLGEFNLEEVQNLASRHFLNREDAIPLMSIVGGHPYLVRLASYHLYHHISVKQLLEDMGKDGGIYQHHLIRYLEYLQNNQELGNVFKHIINQELVRVEQKTIPLKRLEWMGLIKQEGNYVKIRCELYQMYFSNRLN